SLNRSPLVGFSRTSTARSSWCSACCAGTGSNPWSTQCFLLLMPVTSSFDFRAHRKLCDYKPFPWNCLLHFFLQVSTKKCCI
ncbi:hypothetical protein JTE90_027180, partial [Oedothorax gibbosus]